MLGRGNVSDAAGRSGTGQGSGIGSGGPPPGRVASPSSPLPRVSQRRPMSCSECSRRKLRCSKTIPCTSCIDRGLEATCAREKVIVRKRINITATASPSTSSSEPATSPGPMSVDRPGSITIQSLCQEPDLDPSREAYSDPSAAPTSLFAGLPERDASRYAASTLPVDLLLSLEQAMVLLRYHQTHLAYLSNVLHMPTVLHEVEAAFHNKAFRTKAWLALYFAVLCVSPSLRHRADESMTGEAHKSGGGL